MRALLFIVTCVSCLPLTGCIPLQQSDVSGGKAGDYFRYYGDYGLLNIGPADKKKTVTLLPQSSYAISPTGIKYGIYTEPHWYDLDQKFSYIRDHITLVNPRGSRISSIPQNGTWQFHFEFMGPRGKDSRDFTSKILDILLQPYYSWPSELKIFLTSQWT